MSIQQSEVREGDKLRVTYTTSDTERQVIGIADRTNGSGTYWYTQLNAVLVNSHRSQQRIELLERAKTPEEILKERRNKLAKDLGGGSYLEEYHNCTLLSQKAIDRIIKLEDEKEALTK